jgi:hypothetical protein
LHGRLERERSGQGTPELEPLQGGIDVGWEHPDEKSEQSPRGGSRELGHQKAEGARELEHAGRVDDDVAPMRMRSGRRDPKWADAVTRNSAATDRRSRMTCSRSAFAPSSPAMEKVRYVAVRTMVGIMSASAIVPDGFEAARA